MARGWGGSWPWGAVQEAIAHRQLCTKAVLIKGQVEPARGGLTEAIKGHVREEAIGAAGSD